MEGESTGGSHSTVQKGDSPAFESTNVDDRITTQIGQIHDDIITSHGELDQWVTSHGVFTSSVNGATANTSRRGSDDTPHERFSETDLEAHSESSALPSSSRADGNPTSTSRTGAYQSLDRRGNPDGSGGPIPQSAHPFATADNTTPDTVTAIQESSSPVGQASIQGHGSSGDISLPTRTRSMGTERDIVLPRWQPDAEVTYCPICRTQFSFFVRKHHCR